jgi:hypothetical protein
MTQSTIDSSGDQDHDFHFNLPPDPKLPSFSCYLRR